MHKNIVLLSDGTGNTSAKVWRSNVWRFFQALDLTNSKQVACYDDGIGTSAFKPLAILGGVFGWGLKRNVLDLYEFLCRNYEENCQIYLLGFSRGAFTVRVLGELIVSQGIVKADSVAELDQRATAAYRAYRRARYHTILGIEEVFRGIRDLFLRLGGGKPYDCNQNIPAPDIRFVGVWDTVAAYGLPIEEMTRGVSLWLWPLELPNRRLSKKVKRACHALSLDDERTTFHPVLWTEVDESAPPLAADGKRYIKDERLSQVWFAGTHAGVGGGYPDDSLAQIALVWMMKEAQHCGLRFKEGPDADPDALLQAISSRDKDGRLYDSRNGLGGYYRYGPRKIEQLCDTRFSPTQDDAVWIDTPKIHASAIDRRINGAQVYAPIGLPAKYAVVTDDGLILEGLKDYELPDHAERRADGQEHVWNIVWKRRVVYFLTVAASAHLALFPLIYETHPAAEFSTPFRLVSEAIRLVGGFLPGFFSLWLNSYATNPGKFILAVIAIAVLIWYGARLGGKITDQMRTIWRAKAQDIPALPSGGIYALRTHWLYQWLVRVMKRQVVPFFSVIAILYVVITIGSHLLFHIWDARGAHCKKSETLKEVLWLQEVVIEKPFNASDLCWASGVRLDERKRYSVTITQLSPVWKDVSPLGGNGITTGLGGFRSSKLPTVKGILMTVAAPLRRVFLRPWFRVIGRIGEKGTDEYFFDPDPQQKPTELSVAFTTRRGGELFLYVNEAVVGWPRFADVFYRKNQGFARVKIKSLPR